MVRVDLPAQYYLFLLGHPFCDQLGSRDNVSPSDRFVGSGMRPTGAVHRQRHHMGLCRSISFCVQEAVYQIVDEPIDSSRVCHWDVIASGKAGANGAVLVDKIGRGVLF
jgi:hypothetical protein